MSKLDGAMKAFIFITLLISVFLTSTGGAVESLEIPHYNLSVSFDIQRNLIKGNSTIILSEKRELNISTGNLKIISMKLNGSPIEPEIKRGMIELNVKGALEIAYEGIFREEYEREDLENVGVVSKNIISDKGIYLTGGWYPSIEGLKYYSLKAFLPGGFIAISEAVKTTVMDAAQGKEYSFNFPHPLNDINLIAGKYTELKETSNGVDIYGYFFPEDLSLAKTYIEYTKKYLKMYEELLSPYPYKRFSVVENFLPTGYSMPTFTLLGQEVVRLPFIVETSLGHEILHQWFGNLVYVDYKNGNWSEGLTSYLSDHLYKEQEGKGRQHRKKLLIDYQSYVSPDKETTLKDFSRRTDFASKSIGYGKGAMVFHMLKSLAGDDIFYRALRDLIRERAYQEASWDDIKIAFENALGKDIGWFFNQWLLRKGVISIEIKDPRAVILKGVPTVSFAIIQKGEPYKFNLSLKINTNKGEITELLNIEKERETFEIPVEGIPLELVFDGEYELMRKLLKEEYPPVISRLVGDEKRLIVVPEKDSGKYDDLVDVFRGEGFAIKEEKEIKDKDIMTSSLLVLGFDSPILKRLFGGVERPGPGFSLIIKENPLNTSGVIAIADGNSKEEVDPVSKKIFHYGKYSFIRFEKGKNMEKKTDESKQGIRVSLYEPVLGIQPQKSIKLDEIINNILDKTIIYLGERHTNYEEHKVQLNVIMSLYEKGRKFAIGMEMFQKPFQKALDDYISGTITEKELLKASQYFKRWKFDYNLYREIINFAKAKNIPIVALNLRSEIIEKVSKGGLDALTDEEKKEIPEDMNMWDENYRKRLKKIFEQHEKYESKNFDYFYQSQILWDETMANSVNEFLKKNPDYQIVVLAGVGHIMYGSGIPKRAYRLNSKDYVTLMPDSETIDEDAANFVLFPVQLSLPPAPKLGVILKEIDGKVKIEEVRPGSIAGEAGIKKNDVFISLDDWKIEAIEDVKIFLFDKKHGETMKVKILRKKFLVGEKELEFTVTL
jgi:aminopeptidase N